MKKGIRIAVNVFLGIMPFAVWITRMGGSAVILDPRGLESLRHFTVLSNLLEGTASLLWLLSQAARRGRHRAEVFKYIACICVFLTFMTVMVFLGPLYGYGFMFRGANFWFHLVIPVAAVLEMVFLAREDISLSEAACAVIPVLAYGAVYLGNIIVNGRGDEKTGWNDFYGFARWGIPVGILIFAGICLIVFGAGLLLRRIMRRSGSAAPE